MYDAEKTQELKMLCERLAYVMPLEERATVEEKIRQVLIQKADPNIFVKPVSWDMPAIHCVAQHGSLELLNAFIAAGVDVKVKDASNTTVLHGAKPELVQTFIHQGVDPTAQDDQGKTALHFYVKWDKPEGIAALLANGVNVNAQCSDGKAVWLAGIEARIGARSSGICVMYPEERARYLKILMQLMRAGADVNTRIGPFQETALQIAVSLNDIEAAKELVSMGADVYATSRNLYHKLEVMDALDCMDTINKCTKVMSDFLHATKKEVEEKGKTASPEVKKEKTEALQLILSQDFDAKDVTVVGKIARLVAEGADANVKSDNGVTALLVVSKYCHLSTLNDLLKIGANVRDTKTSDGRTALGCALLSTPYNQKFLATLVRAGADVNELYQGVLPIVMASDSSYPTDVVKVLLGGGADINTTDASGESLIHRALYTAMPVDAPPSHMGGYNSLFATWLIANGADVNTKDKNGDSVMVRIIKNPNPWHDSFIKTHNYLDPLVKAGAQEVKQDGAGTPTLQDALTYLGQWDETILCWLLKHGADVNAKDKDGTPVIMLLAKQNISAPTSTQCLKILLKSGANLDVKDKDGKTVLEVYQDCAIARDDNDGLMWTNGAVVKPKAAYDFLYPIVQARAAVRKKVFFNSVATGVVCAAIMFAMTAPIWFALPVGWACFSVSRPFFRAFAEKQAVAIVKKAIAAPDESAGVAAPRVPVSPVRTGFSPGNPEQPGVCAGLLRRMGFSVSERKY